MTVDPPTPIDAVDVPEALPETARASQAAANDNAVKRIDGREIGAAKKVMRMHPGADGHQVIGFRLDDRDAEIEMLVIGTEGDLGIAGAVDGKNAGIGQLVDFVAGGDGKALALAGLEPEWGH